MLFRGEYDFLSNFYMCDVKVWIDGYYHVFRSSENAYVAMKTLDLREREFISRLTPGQAKRHGREADFPLRSDWDQVKDRMMLEIVRAKFDSDVNIDITEKLLAIKGEIVEDNTWGDTYWGVCDGKGQNKLGKILMRVRDEIATEMRFNI